MVFFSLSHTPGTKRAPYQHFRKWFTLTNMDQVLGELRGRSFRGLDGVRPDTFESTQLSIAKRKVLAGEYRFTPYVERLVSKGRDKPPRVLAQPTVRDRIVLQILKEVLHSIFPERVGRDLPNQLVREVRSTIETVSGQWVARFDIRTFYDNIDHASLLNVIERRVKSRRILVLIRRAIQNPTVPRHSRRTDRPQLNSSGVPQGLPISNILAEIYLTDFDNSIAAQPVYWRRFVDDIVVIGSATEISDAETTTTAALAELGLELNPDKRRCSPLERGFDFLGYHLTPHRTSVRQASVDRFIGRLVGRISRFRSRTFSGAVVDEVLECQYRSLMTDVNLMITGAISDKKSYGWVLYFIELNDLDLLFRMDRLISRFLERVDLTVSSPIRPRRLVRTYFEGKYNRVGGYIFNFDNFDSIDRKREFLVSSGELTRAEADEASDLEVHRRFESHKWSSLLQLDQDVGTLS